MQNYQYSFMIKSCCHYKNDCILSVSKKKFYMLPGGNMKGQKMTLKRYQGN